MQKIDPTRAARVLCSPLPLLLTFILLCSSVSVSAKSSAKSPKIRYRACVTCDDLYGRPLTKHFYDLKHVPRRFQTTASALPYFDADNMNGVRIPIFGTDDVPAHPAQGVVVGELYDLTIRSVKSAIEARKGKELTIFASKKLKNIKSFPSWVLDDDGVVDPNMYSEMLVDYALYHKSQGIEIDVLGVDNETEYNKAGISAKIYAQIVDRVKQRFAEEGLKIPQFIAHERFAPEGNVKGSFLKELYAEGLDDRMDIYGTHFYPQHVNNVVAEKLTYEIGMIGTKEFWATEPHWDAEKPNADNMYSAEQAICALWYQTDLGLDNIIWWDYFKTNKRRSYLMYEFTVPLLNAQPAMVVDHDGDDLTRRGVLHTRAFVDEENKLLHLYIVNVYKSDGEGARGVDFKNYEYTIGDRTIAASSVSCLQFRDDSPATGELTELDVVDGNKFYLDVVANSITHITISLKQPQNTIN